MGSSSSKAPVVTANFATAPTMTQTSATAGVFVDAAAVGTTNTSASYTVNYTDKTATVRL